MPKVRNIPGTVPGVFYELRLRGTAACPCRAGVQNVQVLVTAADARPKSRLHCQGAQQNPKTGLISPLEDPGGMA